MITSSHQFDLQPGNLLVVALAVLGVGVLLDIIRTLIGALIRDRPRGLRHLLAWALTNLLIEIVAPHTLFSEIARIVPPLVFIAWFLWNYYGWLESRNPSLGEQLNIARRVVRIFIRAQLNSRAFGLALKRSNHLLGRGWVLVKTAYRGCRVGQ